jgi:hypothetical protein
MKAYGAAWTQARGPVPRRLSGRQARPYREPHREQGHRPRHRLEALPVRRGGGARRTCPSGRWPPIFTTELGSPPASQECRPLYAEGGRCGLLVRCAVRRSPSQSAGPVRLAARPVPSRTDPPTRRPRLVRPVPRRQRRLLEHAALCLVGVVVHVVGAHGFSTFSIMSRAPPQRSNQTASPLRMRENSPSSRWVKDFAASLRTRPSLAACSASAWVSCV